LKMAVQIPGIQHLTARVIGMGVRPEHVKGARAETCPVPRVARIAIGVGAAMGVAALAVGLVRKRRREAAA